MKINKDSCRSVEALEAFYDLAVPAVYRATTILYNSDFPGKAGTK